MLLSLFLFVCLVVISQARPTMAAAKNYMKKLKGISWDLKPNKQVNFQTMFAGIGMHSQKVRITNWEITDADEPGCKKLTFTMKYDQRWHVTKSQVHAMANSSLSRSKGRFGGLSGFWIVDYHTGINLETENNGHGVTVTSTDTSILKTKTYKDQHGCYIKLSSESLNVTVIYPSGYTGLTIGVTGSRKTKTTTGDQQFIAGKKPFGKTSFYDKNNKKIAHFMRVTK